MASSLNLILFLCLASGMWTGANAQSDGDLCPPSWTQHGDFCYMFHGTDMKTWVQAEIACRLHGGTLPSIHTQNGYEFLKEILRDNTNADATAWIGGYLDQDGEWKWSDESDFVVEGEPPKSNGGHCLEMNHTGQVDDAACFAVKPFICAKKL